MGGLTLCRLHVATVLWRLEGLGVLDPRRSFYLCACITCFSSSHRCCLNCKQNKGQDFIEAPPSESNQQSNRVKRSRHVQSFKINKYPTNDSTLECGMNEVIMLSTSVAEGPRRTLLGTGLRIHIVNEASANGSKYFLI